MKSENRIKSTLAQSEPTDGRNGQSSSNERSENREGNSKASRSAIRVPGLFSHENTPTAEEIGEQTKRDGELKILRDREDVLESKLHKREGEQCEEPRVYKKAKQWGTWLKVAICSVLLLFCFGMAITNAAQFAMTTLQNWWLAALFASVIPMSAVGLEVYASLFPAHRGKLNAVMAMVFAISSIGALIGFAQAFAFSEGIDGLIDTLGAFDNRVMFICQSLVELTLGYGLIAKIGGWLPKLRKPVMNSHWEELDETIAALREQLWAVQGEIAILEGEMEVFTQHKAESDAWQDKCARFLRS